MSFTADAHADTFLKPYLMKRNMDMLGLPSRLQVTGNLMREGGLDFEVFAIFVPPGTEVRAREVALEMMAEGKDLLAAEEIRHVTGMAGLEDAVEQGDPCGIISLEGALPLGERAENLEMFYEKGIRLLTLTWSRKNAFATGVGKSCDHTEGLTREGRHLLELAAQLGVVVDVSHLNRQGTKEALEITDMPVIASHSCASGVNPHPRNLLDYEIEAIAAAGGMVGVNFYPEFLNGTKRATIRDVVAHMEYLANIGGVATIGLGTDFDGINAFPPGLEDVSELGNLERELEAGFSRKEIEMIMGGNFKRVLGDVWK